MLLGWKKRSFDIEPAEDKDSSEELSEDRQDSIVEAVLESAAQKVREECIEAGEVFELPLAEVPLEPDRSPLEVDLDVALPMKAGNHGLLVLATDNNSVEFQCV